LIIIDNLLVTSYNTSINLTTCYSYKINFKRIDKQDAPVFF